MILASLSSSPRRLATVGLVAWLVAACGVPMSAPTPTPTPMPTIPLAGPAYTLGPTAGVCPTSAPAAMTAGSTATVTMTTNFGTIVIKVDASLGANAAGAFTELARCGYYNNVLFHRISWNGDVPFVIQAGDGSNARLPNYNPDKWGSGGPNWTIPDDKVTTPYKRGTVAIANLGTANSGSSQFFIVLSDKSWTDTTPTTYSIFGTVTQGMDVVDKIALVPVGGDGGDTPTQVVVITGTTVTVP
jgi:cyclophilin family peptidyl-prolyl cis-trans isomerase